MKNKIYFPLHLDSDNRGCEAITRSTVKILELNPKNSVALSRNIEVDKMCELDKIIDLIKIKNIYGLRPLSSIIPRIIKKLGIDKNAVSKYLYNESLNKIEKDSIVLSTGGDLYCYKDTTWVSYINRVLTKRNIKTILWGCSIDDSLIDSDRLTDLKRYSAIYVRESISYENLKKKGIKKNVFLYPDPAFILEPKQCKLPSNIFEKKVIGINISNMVNKGSFEMNTIFIKNIIHLIDYILNYTDYSILLIPHVYWVGQDDRILINKIKKLYEKNHRITTIDDRYSYCELRYIISKCYFFIGARTHSVISAYSMGVPALALGYSIKSIGIAKDLMLPSNSVVDCNNLTSDNELLQCFIENILNIDLVKEIYNKNLAIYKNNCWKSKKIIEGILQNGVIKN